MEATTPPPGPLHVFVPSPNDHYSPCTGSANITRLYEISRRHVASGGQALFILGRDIRFDYPTGEAVHVDFPPQLNAEQRQHDLLSGWLGKPRQFRAARYLPAAAVLERNFDGPVFLYNDAAALAPFRERCPRSKLIFYCGNQIWTTFSPGEVRKMLQLADRVICISDFLARDLRRRARFSCGPREYSRLTGKICVIPNCVDLEQFHPAQPRPQNAVPLILFVGRMQPFKGPHLLIEAAKQLRAEGRKFRVRIVGSRAFSADTPLTEYEKKLRDLADPIQDVVEFQPCVNRELVVAEYRSADIFCMPSIWQEPFGMTLLESMASGLPTIASYRGGIPEAAGDAVLYLNPPNSRELAKKIALLLDDPSARREWGQKARRRAEEYSWDRHYGQLDQTLADLAQTTPSN